MTVSGRTALRRRAITVKNLSGDPESPVADDTAAQFAKGVQLHNEKDLTKPATLEVITPVQVRLTISEGRYHQVKRMFAAVGNRVVELHRERIGAITLDENLARRVPPVD